MNRNRHSSQAGFTLLEILLVVVIIGLLVGVAVVRLGSRSGEAKVIATRDQIHAFKTAIQLYELDSGFYPSTEQGLQALIVQPTTAPIPNNWKGPYLDPPVIRKDPWGHDYIYRNPGTKNPNGYDLLSPGLNGTEGDDDDIGNWQ